MFRQRCSRIGCGPAGPVAVTSAEVPMGDGEDAHADVLDQLETEALDALGLQQDELDAMASVLEMDQEQQEVPMSQEA